jgi:hypothetical protein
VSFKDSSSFRTARRVAVRLLERVPCMTSNDVQSEYTDLVARLEPHARRYSIAVREIADAVMPAESGPRAWGRGFGLDRNLAWKLYRAAQSSELAGVLSTFPGRRGLGLAIAGFRRRGCPSALVDEFAAASKDLRMAIEAASLGRDVLNVIAAGGLDSDEERRARARARAAARKGAAALWGIEAAVGLSTYIITPSRRDGWVDLVYLNLIGGLVRWRPGQPWCVYLPIFSFPTSPGDLEGHVEPSELAGLPEVGLDLNPHESMAPLVPSCSDPVGVAEVSRLDDAEHGRMLSYRGGRATIGRPVHLAFGEVVNEAGPMDSTVPDDVVTLNVGTQLPLGRSIMQLLVHRDIRRGGDPIGTMSAMLDPTGRRRGIDPPIRLPLDTEAVETLRPYSLPKQAQPWAEPHRDLIDRGLASIDARREEFRVFRLVVPNPPLGATISLRWRLHQVKK